MVQMYENNGEIDQYLRGYPIYADRWNLIGGCNMRSPPQIPFLRPKVVPDSRGDNGDSRSLVSIDYLFLASGKPSC